MKRKGSYREKKYEDWKGKEGRDAEIGRERKTDGRKERGR